MYRHTQQTNYFETLYNRYANKVYRRCLSLTKDSTKAEDYTHDIFLRVYGSLGDFKERSAFSTWLYSISYNYCMDQLRYAHRTAPVVLGQEHDSPWADPTDQEQLEAQLLRLTQILSLMAPDDVRMLRLKYEDGVDIKTIARQYNLKDSAVKMRLKRTRDKVRRLYDSVNMP